MDRDLKDLLADEDHDGLVKAARKRASKVLRFISGRLFSADADEKWRAVRALGAVVADPELVPDKTVNEMLRRFFWSLNDESGAVPYGIPEAIGEVLHRRKEFQKEFLPILASMMTSDEMSQTGPIERGVIWGLGRVGAPVAEVSPEAVEAIRTLSQKSPDKDARETASEALKRIEGKG